MAELRQTSFFDQPEATPEPEVNEDLARVGGKIAPCIRDFYKLEMLDEGSEWTMDDLFSFVRLRAETQVAPASCDRILRQMRKAGELDYEVVNRQKSLYRFKGRKA